MVTYAQCGKKTVTDFSKIIKVVLFNKIARNSLLAVIGAVFFYIGYAQASISAGLLGVLLILGIFHIRAFTVLLGLYFMILIMRYFVF